MKKGLLIIISGPSGVGKGSIRKGVMDNNTLNLVYSVSMTTRSKRDGEVEGVDYYFVSEDEFNLNLKRHNFIEHTNFVSHNYGTLKSEVTKLRNQGKNVILEIDVNGAEEVMKAKKNENLVTIFIMPPSFEELSNRINHRSTESQDVINKRLTKAKNEMNEAYKYKYVVINDNLEMTIKKIQEIIQKEITLNC